MEMQAYINQNINTIDPKTAHYSQGFMNSHIIVNDNAQRRMKVLFSGCGKAEKDMGLAPIPPLYPFETDFTNYN